MNIASNPVELAATSVKTGPQRAGTGLALLASAVCVYGFVLSASNGFNLYDEPWFLQVLNRLAQGEVLYRDVFFGTTPLAAWLGWLAVKLFGAELLAVKALEALCFGSLVWLTVSSRRLLSGDNHMPWALILALCLFARPGANGPGSLYVPLAAAAAMASLFFFLMWLGERGGAWKWPVLAGAAAGASFAAKYTVGISALAALVAAILLASDENGRPLRGRFHSSGVALAAFAAVGLAALAPAFLQGGGGRMWHYCVGNKANYLRFGSISYINIVWEMVRGLAGPSPGTVLRSLFVLALALLPPAAGVMAVNRWLGRPAESRRTTGVLLFLAALAAGAIPRPDSYHLSSISPAMLLGIGFGWDHLATRSKALSAMARRAAMAVLLVGAACLVFRPVLRAASGRYAFSDIPHFRGVLAEKKMLEGYTEAANILAGLAGNGGTFVASPQAGLYYLLGDMYNPTPFDYPVTSALGESGQGEVIGLMREGWIAVVALDGAFAAGGMAELEGYIRRETDPGGSVGHLGIFRTRPLLIQE